MALQIKTNLPKTFDYIPLNQRNEETPFTVTIKRLTPKEYATIEDKLVEFHNDESMTFTTASTNIILVKNAIINWKNLIDENNKAIVPIYKDGELSDESINLLPPALIAEIANVVVGISKDPENYEYYIGNGDK